MRDPQLLSATGDARTGEESRPGSPRKIELKKEAAQVAAFLAGERSHVVVAYGRRAAGKSELIRNWVVPLMEQSGPVYYGECDQGLPWRLMRGREESVADWNSPPRGMIFVDEFDRFFALPDPQQRAAIEGLMAATRSDASEVTIALVVTDQSLGKIYALREVAPEITDHLFELPEVSLEEGLKRLAAAEQIASVRFDPAILLSGLEELLVTSKNQEVRLSTFRMLLKMAGQKPAPGGQIRAPLVPIFLNTYGLSSEAIRL
ncbi:MAG TPA: hypothetical protein VF845_10735 [Terriglobales bacterium]